MDTQRLNSIIDDYLRDHWNDVVADIDALVSVPSVTDPNAAEPGKPNGPGAAAALECALGIAARLGFETHDAQGYIGIADWNPAQTEGTEREGAPAPAARLPQKPGACGPEARNAAPVRVPYLAIIGHVDTVDAGPGWHFDPHRVTRKDGFLVGRGVIDDKGPIIVALHALALVRRAGIVSSRPWRVLLGTDEEIGMSDVDYYLARYPQPDFLFTPDAEFPVSYGEKGLMHVIFECLTGDAQQNAPEPGEGALGIESIAGGTVMNAVPGEAQATLRDGRTFDAHGRSAHASTPEQGENAIGLLAAQLIASDGLTPREQRFLSLVQDFAAATDGSAVDIAATDDDFGPLTCVPSVIEGDAAHLKLGIDLRFPTTFTAASLLAKLETLAARAGATVRLVTAKEPFLMDPASPYVRTLIDAYNDVTGEEARPFTMGGGTYARKFAHAASFGVEASWEERPAWAGGMHCADEAVSEHLLQTALRIYAHAIARLSEMECDDGNDSAQRADAANE